MEPEVATTNTQFNTITEEEEHQTTDSDSQEDLLDNPDLQGPGEHYINITDEVFPDTPKKSSPQP